MKVLNLNVTHRKGYEVLKVAIVFAVIALLWPIAQQLVLNYDDTAGYISPGSICFTNVNFRPLLPDYGGDSGMVATAIFSSVEFARHGHHGFTV